ncbi:MAG: MBL fold metallo-hydrolase [Clostridia bacterium]|nr:MBL fold metallo-hydrolase [Clostridia bacterium]
MDIVNLFPGSFASNCYLLLHQGDAAIVDPSAPVKAILSATAARGATLRYVLLTHGHFDHVLALDELRKEANVPAYVHADDADMLSDPQKNAFHSFFGVARAWRAPDNVLSDGDTLSLGGEEIRILHTPGHSRGSACYLCNGEFLITGDTLFDGNVGRCDLYGGDMHALARSLERLRSLPPHLPIYPGHGSATTLGDALDRVLA